jgi:hypothetical protein
MPACACKLTPALPSPQEHVDYLSLQALLFGRERRVGPLQRTRLFFQFQKRLTG